MNISWEVHGTGKTKVIVSHETARWHVAHVITTETPDYSESNNITNDELHVRSPVKLG